MEFLKKLILQTKEHLKGLTLSQRMAIGLCVALIALSLLWMVNWASEPELVPLLPQPMSPEELERIDQQLTAQGVKTRVAGEMIMVPAEHRHRLLAQLSQNEVLPDDISIGFAKLLEENSSPWLNMQEQDRRWALALGNELSRVLRQDDAIESARVFIDKNMRRVIGQPSITPTASVFVKLTNGESLSRTRVHQIANLVSSAVAGLDIYNVAVTDATTGRSDNVPRPEEGFAFDDLDDRKKKEEYFAEAIRDLLGKIPGVMVKVHAELDPESRRQTKQEYDKPFEETYRKEDEKQTSGVVASEPGVVPNTSREITPGGTTEMLEKKVTESTMKGEIGSTLTTTETPRHNLKSLYAAVNVPRSYLARIYKQESGNEEDPTDAELKAAPSTASELEKIRRQVVTGLGLTNEDHVVVDYFYDDIGVAMDGFTEAGMGGGMMDLVAAHWDKAGLGALAVVSLVMMLMMVRKVSEGPVLPGEEPPDPRIIKIRGERRDEEPMVLSEPPIGEASESEALMVGKEVDEATVRTQQVVDQVSELVNEDPDAAARILQRWIDLGRQ